MALGLSHGGTTMYSSAKPSTEVLVGTMRGVVLLEGGAAQGWRVAHEALEDFHIQALLHEGESGLWFAGGYNVCGVHVSADGGRSWEPRNEGLTQTNVYSLAAARVNECTRLFAGTEPVHLFYSDDLGQSWQEFTSLRAVPSAPTWRFATKLFGGHAKHINFNPADARTMYVSIEVGGLLKSTDAGESWEELPVRSPDLHRTVIDPRDPDRIFAPGGDGVYVTSDGGSSWEHWMDRQHEVGGYPDQLMYLPSNPDIMVIASSRTGPRSWRRTGTADAKVARSVDGGRNWEVLTNGYPRELHGNIEAMCLEEAEGAFSLFAGTTDGEVLWSPDGGDTWSMIATGLAPISKGIHAAMLAGLIAV